jgi:hypothetical protein
MIWLFLEEVECELGLLGGKPDGVVGFVGEEIATSLSK